MTVGVGSPDVSRNSRQSEVTTHAESPDAQSLSLRSDCGCRKSRPKSGVLTQVCMIRLDYTHSNEFTFNLCTRFVPFQHTKHMKWYVRTCTELGYRVPSTKPNMA